MTTQPTSGGGGTGESPDSLSLFHEVGALLPEEQQVVSVSSDATVIEALELLLSHGFSQLPIVEGSQVLGVFSYRSFAKRLMERQPRLDGRDGLASLLADDFAEELEFVRVSDRLERIFEWLDRDDAVLVGDPERLQAVATSIDVVHYLYRVAGPFVLLQEIELGLRALIREAVDQEQLAACARRALAHEFTGREDEIPVDTAEMTFAQQIQTIIDGRNFDLFAAVLGGARDSVRLQLGPVRELRNDVVHFRRELTVEDYERLVECRQWVFRKIRRLRARTSSD